MVPPVMVTDTATEYELVTVTVVSDRDGRYHFPAGKLTAGRYDLAIRAVGYQLDRPFVVDSSAFEETFGVRATPLEEALATTVAMPAAAGSTELRHQSYSAVVGAIPVKQMYCTPLIVRY